MKKTLVCLFAFVFCCSVLAVPEQKEITFLMVYETHKPLDIDRCVLFSSNNKLLSQKEDSMVLTFKQRNSPDSIRFDTVWQHPVYLKLKLISNGQVFESQIFSNSGSQLYYDAFVNDSTIRVRPKLSGNNFDSNSSFKALILVLQAIFEMLIAFLISRVFGVPRMFVLMVLVANIAAYPLYLFNIGVLNRELLVFLVKTGVMSLIGMKKIKIYKILVFSTILAVIGIGIKEILFFIIRLI